jgi:hypothetical protein
MPSSAASLPPSVGAATESPTLSGLPLPPAPASASATPPRPWSANPAKKPSGGGGAGHAPCSCSPGDPLCSCSAAPGIPKPGPRSTKGGAECGCSVDDLMCLMKCSESRPQAKASATVPPSLPVTPSVLPAAPSSAPTASSPPATATLGPGETKDVHEDYIGFNPKQPMRLYEEDTVTFSAGRALALVQKRATVPDLPPPDIETVTHTGSQLEVDLSGDGFTIVPASKARIQDIDNPSEPAVWIWFVTPQKPGKHPLVLSVCFHSTANGVDLTRCDPSEQREIDVIVTGLVPRLKYVATEYTWAAALVPAGMVGTIGSWVWTRLRKSKKKKERKSPGGSTAHSPQRSHQASEQKVEDDATG